MKRILMLIVAIALLGSCVRPESLVDHGYSWNFYVENQTGHEIILNGSHVGSFIIVLGEKRMIVSTTQLGGESHAKLEDTIGDDSVIGVEGVIGIGDDIWGMPFTMTIGSKEVSDEMWLKKYWSFESDLYNRNYTLIVTDELLEELGWEE